MEQVLTEGLTFNSGAHLTCVFLSRFLCCSHQSHCKDPLEGSNSRQAIPWRDSDILQFQVMKSETRQHWVSLLLTSLKMEQPTPFLDGICLRTSSTQGRPTANTSRLHWELVVLENCICVRSRRHCHTRGITTLFFLSFSHEEKPKENSSNKELFGCLSVTVLPSWSSSVLPSSLALSESTFT